MNARLEQAWKDYCSNHGSGTMISVNVKDVAQHFYNLALKDVKKECYEKYKEYEKLNYPINNTICARLGTYGGIIGFIDKLMK